MTRYVLTILFREKVRAGGLPHHALARIGGLAHADFNRFLQGMPFGTRSRQRLLLVGEVLGLAAESCCDAFKDPLASDGSMS